MLKKHGRQREHGACRGEGRRKRGGVGEGGLVVGVLKELGHGHSTSWKSCYFTERFNGKKQQKCIKCNIK